MTGKVPESNFKTCFEQSGLKKSESKYNLNEIQIKQITEIYNTYMENKEKKCNQKYGHMQ